MGRESQACRRPEPEERLLFPIICDSAPRVWQEETAQLILDYMEERVLPDQLLLQRARATRHQRTAAAGEEERCPRLVQSVRAMPLDEAFRRLDVPEPQLAAFGESGAHMAELRRRWRTLVLANHTPTSSRTSRSETEQETGRRRGARPPSPPPWPLSRRSTPSTPITLPSARARWDDGGRLGAGPLALHSGCLLATLAMTNVEPPVEDVLY